MKKKTQLSIRKLSLSKKTISFLDSQAAAHIVGGSDPYGGGCISQEIHCASPSQYCTNGCPTGTCNCASATCNPDTSTCPPPTGGDSYQCPNSGGCPMGDYTLPEPWGGGC